MRFTAPLKYDLIKSTTMHLLSRRFIQRGPHKLDIDVVCASAVYG